MEVAQALKENIPLGDIGRGAIAVLALTFIQTSSRSSRSWRLAGVQTIVARFISGGGFLLLFLFARIWFSLVTYYVPEPYLDEVFHVPQAQTYCNGSYFEWDDKITTPPGLYVLSVWYHKLWRIPKCTPYTLRDVNLTAILQVALFASTCRSLIESKPVQRKSPSQKPQAYSFYAIHTSFNIALFPPLFFFSALFYTDVVSTQFVLLAYENYLRRTSPGGTTVLNDLWTILIGVGALMMRQTNVFWIVVYMGGLEVVHVVKQLRPTLVKEPYFTTVPQVVRYYAWRYSLGDIHDPPLNYAWPDDWLFCGLSIGTAAVCNPLKVLRQVWPHITIMGLFTGFVVWNGGVVLGDKSNHIATIHLAQMLYLWPLFAFFSAPLLLPGVVAISLFMYRFIYYMYHSPLPPPPPRVPNPASQAKSGSTRPTMSKKEQKNRPIKSARVADPRPPRSAALRRVGRFFYNMEYYFIYLPATFLLSFVVVKYNTIIHPFTLADNRHYMFYVFRYTILRSGQLRYLLVLVYTICRWFVWGRMAGCSPRLIHEPNPACPASSKDLTARQTNRPFATYSMSEPRLEAIKLAEAEARNVETGDAPEDQQPPQSITLDDPSSTSAIPPSTSTALLWLLATTLSLVTAPLVEPRYFILPWVFWRLLVPAWPAHECIPHDDEEQQEQLNQEGISAPSRLWALLGSVGGWMATAGGKIDMRLVLETVWFVGINVATMYMFLFRPFFWRAEDGTLLDGGRVQRFMW